MPFWDAHKENFLVTKTFSHFPASSRVRRVSWCIVPWNFWVFEASESASRLNWAWNANILFTLLLFTNVEKFFKRARSSRALSHWANSFPFYLTVPKTRESSTREAFFTDTRNHIYRFVSNNTRAENVDLFGANLLLVLFATETAPPRKSVSWKYFGMKMMKIWERYQMRELWVFSERAFRLLISNRAHEPLGYKMFALQINSFSQNWGKAI